MPPSSSINALCHWLLLLPPCLLACGDNTSPGADGVDIRGFVWNDENADGVFDANEQAIVGARIFLDSNDDRIVDLSEAQTLSNAAGAFRFEKLAPGDYLVRQDLGFGWRPSSGTGLARTSESSKKSTSEPTHNQIIGGTDAGDMAYPFMASLGGSAGSFSPFCGGALISDRFVLTAAHCSEGEEAADVSIMLGTNNPFEEGLRVGVRAIAVHPLWEGDTEDGWDMSVWELAERLDLAALGLNTVEMLTPGNRSLAQAGALAATIGWGVSDNASELLQEVNVPIVSEDQCADSYPQVRDFETQICAGSVRGGIDSCQGDSGGPLLVRDTASQRWMHAGITSWGDGCALAGKPGIYGRSSAMSDWAYGLMGESSSTYQVSLKRRDVVLNFPNQATTRPLLEELPARWSLSAVELAGVSDGAIAANASFQVRFFLFSDPDFQDQDFSCVFDIDGPGSLEADSFSCKGGTNTIGVSGYPDGIYLPELTITSGSRNQTRSELIRAGEPPSTEVTGVLAVTDSTDSDYPGSTYFIDYFALSDAEVGKAIVVELQSSFGGQVAIYDAQVRDQNGGGILRSDTGGQSTSVFFVPEAGRQYLIGVSSTGSQATGSYTLRIVNNGSASATTL